MTEQKEARRADGASFAGGQRRRPGEVVPGTMRRIGLRHCVVTPAVQVELVDAGRLHRDLELTNEQLGRARQLVAKLEAQRGQLETRIAQFEAAPIERVDGDPDVPVEAEPPEPADNVPPAEAEAAPSPTPAADKPR